MSLLQPRIAETSDPSDAELLTAVRGGDLEAYGELYQRHVMAARHLARQLTPSPAEVDDLVSEAFAKVLDTLQAGGGPDSAFRAYLLTTVRNARYDRARRERKLELSDDMTRHDPGVPWVDTAVAGLEASLAARAFARLPERWQTVLWHTEVERETPAQVAPLLGLTPNGVAALAYRAREGLRQAYLQEHLADVAGEGCRYTVERLGAWARDGLSKREQDRVEEHLAGCGRCRLLAAELEEVNGGLRGILAPLLLGAPLAAAYLASSSAPAEAAVAGGAASATTPPATRADTASAATREEGRTALS
jgi:RNA polymerase sigma factor (sigma-70 family)